MSYKVLARKWRPKKFTEIIGQEHIVQAITHSFALNKIHHAYILSGMQGVGKTTVARLLAKGLNCEKRSVLTICGECNNCRDIESNCFIDLIEIDAASRTKVEDTREFLENVQYMPSRGNFKVYLIDEVHMLSRHSFNALLKTLEEPPSHVKFILVTTECQKLPETILSRCLQFYFKPLDIYQVVKQLTYIFNQENINITSSAVEALAYASKGSMRDALSIAEQAIVLGNNNITDNVINSMFGILNVEHSLRLIEDLAKGDIRSIMNQINHYAVLGVNWDSLLGEMLSILNKIAIGQFLSNPPKKENKDMISNIDQRIHKLCNDITPENIQLYYQVLLLGRRELPYTPSHRMGVEITMLRALAFRVDDNLNGNGFINQINNPSSNYIHSDINDVSNKKNKIHIGSNIYTQPKPYIKNNNVINKQRKYDDVLHISAQKYQYDSDEVKIKNPKQVATDVDTTSEILKIRSELLQYKEHDYSDTTKESEYVHLRSTKTIKDDILLTRLSNLNTKTLGNNSHYINDDKIDKNLSNNIKHNTNVTNIKHISNHAKVAPSLIKNILQQAMKNDPWILQIYQLSLSQEAKKIVMNSWKEEVSSNEIYLHIRSKYKHFNSIALQNMIQKSIGENVGTTVTLHIIEDDNYSIKTPMELINILFSEKMLQIKQEFSKDPYIKMIKDIFNAKFELNDIKIL